MITVNHTVLQFACNTTLEIKIQKPLFYICSVQSEKQNKKNRFDGTRISLYFEYRNEAENVICDVESHLRLCTAVNKTCKI